MGIQRDLTPKELYLSDKQFGGRANSHRPVNEKSFVYGEKSKYVYSFSQRRILSKYEYLGFLFTKNLLHCWDEMSEHPRIRKEVLDDIEDHLERVISNLHSSVSVYGCKEVVYKWFMGELDPNFYYSWQNDLLLERYIMGEYSRRLGDKGVFNFGF